MVKQLEKKESWLPSLLLQVSRRLVRISREPLVEWVLLFLSILPFFLISAYNHPTDDDFQGTVLAQRLGLWESIWFYYKSWTGRYTSSFLYGLSYAAPTLQSWLIRLRLAPVLFLTTFLLSGRFAVGVLNPGLPNATKWRVAIYLLVLYLCGIPLIASAFYWASGAAVYTSGIILLLWLIGAIGKYTQAEALLERNIWGAVSACSAFLLAGTNELCMLVMLVGLVCWGIWAPGKLRLWRVLIPLAALVGGILTLVAPGNFARAATINMSFPFARHLLTTTSKTIYLTTIHLTRWATNGMLLLAAVMIIVSSPRYPIISKKQKTLFLVGCAGVLLTFVLAVPTVWLTNDVPSRIWNTIYFVFLLSWLAFVYLLSRWIGFRGLRHRTLPYHNTMRVIWLLLVFFRQDTNIHQAWIDLAFKARAYDAVQQKRYELLHQAKLQHQQQVHVPPLFKQEYEYPSTIFLHELELFSHDIANEGMAEYFGLDSVYSSTLPERTRRHFRD